MTTIQERLRRVREGIQDARGFDDPDAETILASIHRIDALEAALRYVVQYERDMSPDYGLIPPWALAARNALEAS